MSEYRTEYRYTIIIIHFCKFTTSLQTTKRAGPAKNTFDKLLEYITIVDMEEKKVEELNDEEHLSKEEEQPKSKPIKKDLSFGILGLEADHAFGRGLEDLSNNNQIHVDIEQNLYF